MHSHNLVQGVFLTSSLKFIFHFLGGAIVTKYHIEYRHDEIITLQSGL